MSRWLTVHLSPVRILVCLEVDYMCTRREFLLQSAVGVAVAACARRAQAASQAKSIIADKPMKTTRIAHTDLVISRLAYGSGYLAGENWSRAPASPETLAQASRLIHTAYDNGITFFDLADVYGYGQAELVFGSVLKQSPGLREKIVVQSKCGIRWENEPQPGTPRRIDYSRDYIVSAVEGSLKRLGTDRLDILLLHHPDPLMRAEEVAEAFDALQGSGKVRHFGVSNHSASQIELLKRSVRQPIVTNEVWISLMNPGLLMEGMESTESFLELPADDRANPAHSRTLDYCRVNDILVQAYSPLRGVPLGPLAADASPQRKQLAQALRDIAERRDTTPAAVALAWLMFHPAGIVPITEPRKVEYLVENCTADRVQLTREDWYSLLIAARRVPQPKQI